MQLLTKGLLKSIPSVNSQEETEDPAVVCKFFLPATHWAWYVIGSKVRPGNPTGAGGA